MKALSNIALAAVIWTAAVAAQAGTVRSHFRSNGMYVMPHYRTPANGTPYDNLSYRGYPSQQPGYVLPGKSGFDSSWSRPTPLPSYGGYKLNTMPRPYAGPFTPTPLYRRSSSSGF